MAEQSSARLHEVWGRLVAQAGTDPQLKQRLLADPAGLLKEHGVEVPAGVTIRLGSTPVVDPRLRVLSLLWLDGKMVPRRQFYIDPSDEGLLFGRGLWESTRTFAGVPWLWSLHLDRLRRTAGLLELDVAPERLPDSGQVGAYVRALDVGDVVIRLNVTAGSDGTGRTGIVWMSAATLPDPMAPVRLQTRRSPVLKGEPYLAWKTFQYGGRKRAGQLAGRAGFDSALLLDADNNLLEASHANIFVRLPEGWATPAMDDGLLPGTVRQHLLEQAPLPIREQTVPAARLGEVREAFLTNSIVGIVPIARIDAQTFPIGQETQTLLQWLRL